ncbi:MAG: hypothetical protein ABSB29_01755 [Nitrososphaerales archaeon]|jgi:hypothetical protein
MPNDSQVEPKKRVGIVRSVKSAAFEWLLEENQPSVRWLALKNLFEKEDGDPEVENAREEISTKGWVSEILSRQKPGGWWVSDESLYRPKYLSTNWMLLILSDLGITKENPKIKKACELWMKRYAEDGDFGRGTMGNGELCIVGNTARALVKFGYVDHPSVRSAFEWLVETQKENGGWHCWRKNGVIDGWEGMSAFSVYPRQKWTRSMKTAVERGAEFYLKRKLHREGKVYDPWYRFHYPVHYYYDLLVGLDFITALGYTDDPRLKEALDHLESKMRKDGKWCMDAVHPDAPYAKDPKYAGRLTPFSLEKEGKPSKMITLKALTVLKRVER